MSYRNLIGSYQRVNSNIQTIRLSLYGQVFKLENAWLFKKTFLISVLLANLLSFLLFNQHSGSQGTAGESRSDTTVSNGAMPVGSTLSAGRTEDEVRVSRNQENHAKSSGV